MTPGARLNSVSLNFMPSVVISNYNLGNCPGCNKLINKGDLITRVLEEGNMKLRYRTHKNNSFYTPVLGARFVHKNCRVLDEDGIYLWTEWSGEQQGIEDAQIEKNTR